MPQYSLTSIGSIRVDNDGMRLVLMPQYIPALSGLSGFSHINALWWFDGCDTPAARAKTSEAAPYRGAPETLGTFATRSPERPNPLALSCCEIAYIDAQNGVVWLAYIDAQDGSPLLDIKPYTPSLDRVEQPALPDWCTHWPRCVEASGSFDWSTVFRC